MENTNQNYFAFVSGQTSQPMSLCRVSLEEHIRQSLRSLIFTRVGERAIHVDIGSRVMDRLFRPFVSSLRSEIEGDLTEAIAKGEPRIENVLTEVSVDPQDKGSLLVALSYRVKETRKTNQFKLVLEA